MRDDRPISVHAAGPLGFFRSQALPLFFTAFGILMLCVSLFLPIKEGPEVARIMAAVSAVAIVGCLVWGFIAYAGLIKKVTIYADRVEWGGQIAAWADIRDVWRTEIIVNGTMQTRQVVIKTRDGTEATFMYILDRWAEMAERIQVETAKVLGPKAFAKYETGKAVKFGDVIVSADGVNIAGKYIVWPLIERTTVENGHYCVYQVGEQWSTAQASLGSTPNILVLLRLLELTPRPPVSGPILKKRG